MFQVRAINYKLNQPSPGLKCKGEGKVAKDLHLRKKCQLRSRGDFITQELGRQKVEQSSTVALKVSSLC